MSLWSLEIVIGCLLVAAYVDGRTMGRRPHRQRKHSDYGPVLRSMNDVGDSLPVSSLQYQPEPANTKLVLLKTSNHHQVENSAGDGRTLKHLLMVKGLASAFASSGGGGGGGGGYGGYGGGGGNGYMIPYIIVNTPTNVTNVNNNSISNAPTTTGTTPTTTATRATAVPVRSGSYFLNSAAIPYQLQSTPVTHQRKNNYEYSNQNSQLPFNIAMPMSAPIGMMNINSEMLPFMLPGHNNIAVPAANRRRRGGQRHGGGNNNNNYSNGSGNGANESNDINPFVAFANSLKRIQFL